MLEEPCVKSRCKTKSDHKHFICELCGRRRIIRYNYSLRFKKPDRVDRVILRILNYGHLTGYKLSTQVRKTIPDPWSPKMRNCGGEKWSLCRKRLRRDFLHYRYWKLCHMGYMGSTFTYTKGHKKYVVVYRPRATYYITAKGREFINKFDGV